MKEIECDEMEGCHTESGKGIKLCTVRKNFRERGREMMEHLLLCERCGRCASCSTSQDVINQKDDSKHPLLSGKTHSGTKDGQERERERGKGNEDRGKEMRSHRKQLFKKEKESRQE